MTVPYYANLEADCRDVSHAALERFNESRWRSVCPVCHDGILLGPCRSLTTFQIATRYDRCIRCAQIFKYTDEKINNEELPLWTLTPPTKS